jgi:hypothetical protein
MTGIVPDPAQHFCNQAAVSATRQTCADSSIARASALADEQLRKQFTSGNSPGDGRTHIRATPLAGIHHPHQLLCLLMRALDRGSRLRKTSSGQTDESHDSPAS